MTGNIGNKTKGSREWGRKSRKHESRDMKAAARRAALRKEERELTCPGCINCGPPIMVKAEDGCDGSGRL